MNTGDELLLIPFSPIKVTLKEPKSIVNETLPGHIFYQGTVARAVVECGSAICVRSFGEGRGRIAATNVLLAYPVWKIMDAGVSDFVRGFLP